MDELAKLFNDTSSSDFKICLNGKMLYVHKYVLAAASTYFAALFRADNSAEMNTSRVDFTNYNRDMIHVVIMTIYYYRSEKYKNHYLDGNFIIECMIFAEYLGAPTTIKNLAEHLTRITEQPNSEHILILFELVMRANDRDIQYYFLRIISTNLNFCTEHVFPEIIESVPSIVDDMYQRCMVGHYDKFHIYHSLRNIMPNVEKEIARVAFNTLPMERLYELMKLPYVQNNPFLYGWINYIYTNGESGLDSP